MLEGEQFELELVGALSANPHVTDAVSHQGERVADECSHGIGAAEEIEVASIDAGSIEAGLAQQREGGLGLGSEQQPECVGG